MPGSLTNVTPSAAELCGQRVHGGRVRGAEGDQVEPLVGVLAQPDDVLLGRALGGEVGQVAVGADLGQAPGVLVERALGVVVRHRQVDVTQVGDAELVQVAAHVFSSFC